MIVFQFVIITFQTLLLATNVALFNSTLEFFLYMYVFYSIMVIVNEMDSCLLNPLDSRDLTAIFCVFCAQIFLLAVSLGLVCYMGLWDSGTKPVARTPRINKLSSLMDHGAIHDAFFWILVADLTLQFLWSLYIVLRFFTMFFPDLTRTVVSVPWVRVVPWVPARRL